MPESFLKSLAVKTESLKDEGLYKAERLIAGPQQAAINVLSNGETKEVLNLCANNYLGLANHPEVIAAARKALDDFRQSHFLSLRPPYSRRTSPADRQRTR